ncbi:hypothetical protein UA08_05976 [Talaromyces atroroseus]|uniref:Zn(2)-C6 fungal-type domain-containing protein n=1 Tax=Talaromyces atroroseus TaxID=1441469 RepID=A0A225AMH8_TALAT|nr:hypothetical protein UA08_05976 [Talaromyces atroroseus]OKL58468.1 hypothetical protein UA08_05976 [Talaromyces atroroseus]
MVYRGPSKGCETCKRRRKKCDETRPSCLRCANANRTCGGYERSSREVQIRQYHGEDVPGEKQHVPFYKQGSIARKCSLPVREPLPGTNILPPDTTPKEVNIEQSDDYALGAFFYDYCIASSNNKISPGFLSRLEQMFYSAKSHSMLKKACEAVAYASNGRKLNRPHLKRRGMELYHNVLSWFAVAIHDSEPTKTPEYLAVTTLLGLYEIITGEEAHFGHTNAHAGGIAAMLGIRKSPLYLLEAMRHGHHLLANMGAQSTMTLFPTLGLRRSDRSLDDLLLSLGVLYKHGTAALENYSGASPDAILNMRNDALALDEAFVAWEMTQDKDFHPNTVFHIKTSGNSSHYPVGLWPGKVDTYLDHYIAGVWNLYRASRLSLLDLILQLSDALNDGRSLEGEHVVADFLVEGMLSSIPFHLAEDIHALSSGFKTARCIPSPGRASGGLLLMHSIFATSNLVIVDERVRERTYGDWTSLDIREIFA